jgi:hypothetical protein
MRSHNPDGYVYHEFQKNRQGTFQQLIHLTNKEVPIYACPTAGDRCHVRLLDLYLQKQPSEAIEIVRPLDKIPRDTSVPRYISVSVSRNTLDKKVNL